MGPAVRVSQYLIAECNAVSY
ncbi:hypothetical protein EYZ11_007361 [Aspergillus tanneri]|uniref:Uncharacterized protein n=1 Tax=Aspergillus tanneri TaxID=1220188 RepID=A0A4S3JDI5_9EURO|nr:hypothetical protein EYZ11_007361 [Aspergillus tanneri]